MKKAFISHVFEDAAMIGNIRDWIKDATLGVKELLLETQHDYRQEGKEEVRKKLKSSIEKCDLVLVFIGNDTHNHDWIRQEVELANGMNKPIIPLRIPNSKGAKPPILNNFAEIKFSKKSLNNALLKLKK